MKKQLITCQQLAWEPNPEKKPVVRYPVKEGRNLPNSETEDVGGFSLCPTYSEKELRRINRIRIGKAEREGIYDMMATLKNGGRLTW